MGRESAKRTPGATSFIKLAVSDVQLFEGTKRGSLIHLLNLQDKVRNGDKIQLNPAFSAFHAVDALLSGLSATRLPALSKRDDNAIKVAQVTLELLESVTNGPFSTNRSFIIDVCVRGFPILLSWTEYLISMTADQKSLRSAAATLFHLGAAAGTEFQKQMAMTDRCIKLMARIALKDLKDGDLDRKKDGPSVWALLAMLLGVESCVKGVATAIIRTSKLDMKQLSLLLLDRLCAGTTVEAAVITEFLSNFFTGLKKAQSAHPFIRECLDNGIMRTVTQNLFRVAKSKTDLESPQHVLVIWSLAFLSRHLDSTDDAVTSIAQSLKAGLLPAFIALATRLEVDMKTPHSLDDGIEVLIHILPKYLPIHDGNQYKPMLRHLTLETSPAGKAWVIFEELLEERTQQTKHGVFVDPAICGNPKCDRMGMETDFKKCASCQVTLFCDKDCLTAAWKSGHKEKCPILKKREANKSKTRKSSLMNWLTADSLVQNLPALRQEALKSFHDTPPTELMVQADFTDVPRPKITVIRVSEFKETLGGRLNSEGKHSERHCDIDYASIDANPKDHTIVWGIFATGEGTVQDAVVTLTGHWILDEGFNGRKPDSRFTGGRNPREFVETM
ncbi:hypothetical protein C8J56DRAFT_1157493 [Mycena floridula]|nr:hypothetical protein C8J56DRAFT_1157493 [Mycena floridula]